MAAIVGAAGLSSCLAAARAGKRLLLANKEALVVGGEFFLEAVKQAKSTDGATVRAALEDLTTPVQGLLKTYDKPFSKTTREALTAKDLVWIKWSDGKLLPYNDAIIGSFQPADFKQ